MCGVISIRDQNLHGDKFNMRKTLGNLTVILFVYLLGASPIPAVTKSPLLPSTLAFVNVTVIDATGARPKLNMTVLVTGGRIAGIGRTDKLKVPESARVVDATGKFLIPGLWDMHTHIWDKDMLFPAYLANGITGVRDMGGVLEPWIKWRTQIREGGLQGPRSVIGGKIVDGFKPFFYFFVQAASADQGRENVRSLKVKGADFIKVYDRLPREIYFAIVDEAKQQKLSFAGHVPAGVKASEASAAGQKSIEHLTGIALESSTDEAKLRTEAINALNEVYREGLKPEEMGVGIRRSYKLSRSIPLETYSEKKAKGLFKLFRRNRTWQVPTLVVREDFGDEELRRSIAPHLKYFPDYVRGMILPESKATDEELAENKRHFQKEMEIVRAMHRAGVRFLAGADAPNPYSVPGFGLHDELALLVRAGFTPLEALQTATRNPAEFLGQLDSLGTIERGKIADLVLLEADPLADINNTRKIAAVVLAGELVSKPQLKEMLDSIEARANKK
jgi:imidazolonepropionase-like amidohydrolase